MGKRTANTLYSELMKVSQPFLGPATSRFLSAMIKHHLDKSPQQIVKQDIAILLIWLEPALSAITNDNKEIRSYIAAVKKLAQ